MFLSDIDKNRIVLITSSRNLNGVFLTLIITGYRLDMTLTTKKCVNNSQKVARRLQNRPNLPD